MHCGHFPWACADAGEKVTGLPTPRPVRQPRCSFYKDQAEIRARKRASAGNPGGPWCGTVGTQARVLKFAFDRGVAEEAFMRTIPLAFIAFAALSLSTTGARAADGSWCANYGTGHSGINCTYTSQQQCLASVSGVYGFCTPNPYPGTGYGRGGSWNLPPNGRARGRRNG